MSGATPRVHWEVVALLGAVALFVPNVVGTSLPVWTTAVTLVLVFLGLGLMVWTSGQISLAHAAFAAIGAAGMSHFLGNGLPWGLALLASGLVAVPVAIAVALPTLRLSGLYLALATFTFAVLLQQLVYPTEAMFGGGVRAVSRPEFSLLGLDLASDKGYYYLCVAAAAAAAALVFGIQRARLGRLLQANAESPDAVAANGGDTTTIRTAVFCVAGFLGAVGGALASGVTLQASSRGYGYTVGLTWVAVLALFGSRATIVRASAAAFSLAVMPTLIELDPGWYTAIFGWRTEQQARVEEALEACGIAHLAGRRAGSLSTGQRRLVEPPAAAGRSEVLLLDDRRPASTRRDQTFATIVRTFVDTTARRSSSSSTT